MPAPDTLVDILVAISRLNEKDFVKQRFSMMAVMYCIMMKTKFLFDNFETTVLAFRYVGCELFNSSILSSPLMLYLMNTFLETKVVPDFTIGLSGNTDFKITTTLFFPNKFFPPDMFISLFYCDDDHFEMIKAGFPKDVIINRPVSQLTFHSEMRIRAGLFKSHGILDEKLENYLTILMDSYPVTDSEKYASRAYEVLSGVVRKLPSKRIYEKKGKEVEKRSVTTVYEVKKTAFKEWQKPKKQLTKKDKVQQVVETQVVEEEIKLDEDDEVTKVEESTTSEVITINPVILPIELEEDQTEEPILEESVEKKVGPLVYEVKKAALKEWVKKPQVQKLGPLVYEVKKAALKEKYKVQQTVEPQPIELEEDQTEVKHQVQDANILTEVEQELSSPVPLTLQEVESQLVVSDKKMSKNARKRERKAMEKQTKVTLIKKPVEAVIFPMSWKESEFDEF
jgi:hypothetical protein